MEVMAQLDDAELDDLTAANLVEILRSGCTTQVEMRLDVRQARSYVRTAGRLGLRGYPAGMVPSLVRVMPIWGRSDDRVLAESVPETLAEVESNLAFGLGANGSFDRIRPMMAITVTVAHTRETLLAVAVAAEQLGNGIQMHVQGGSGLEHDGKDLIVRACGKSELPLLEELGLLRQRVVGAHMIDTDVEAGLPFARPQPHLHLRPLPVGGRRGASARDTAVPEVLAAGVNTAIGLDAHSADLLENLKQAVIQGRARAQLLAGSSPLPLRRPSMLDAIRSATVGAACGLGRDDLGRLTPGAKADLCSVDVSGLFTGGASIPMAPLNNLLYASGLSVRNVMTNGAWQLVDGSLVVEDEARVIRRRQVVMDKLHELLAAEGFDPRER